MAFHADISRIIKYAPAQLIGREAETQLLSDAWDQVVRGETQRPHVLTFVALGGEGKTSLVAKWAADLAHRGWPGCEAVFAWSFYHQGSDEKTADSSDLFLNEALTVFGDPALANSAQGAFDKGRRLAQLVGERRALLILDGLEPLQYAPASPTRGELKDAGLAALLKGLAANNHGLCVITTRYSIPDLRAYWQTTAPQTPLARLSKAAGVALLQSLGVKGKQPEFETLVEDVQGHALTLNLLGSYLHEAHAGDIRKRDLVQLGEADAEQGGHAFRVMDAYVTWFEREGEDQGKKGKRALAVLRLLGLFDRPATADCFAALLKAPAIPGLTEALVGTSEAQRNLVFSRLESARLLTVNRNAAGALLALDAHPLMRDYFARQLPTQQPEAWRAAHRRLFEHLCSTTKEGDEPTLEDLQPLYQAVAHGCQAGMQQEACDDVYYDRIQREWSYSTNSLGAFSSDLGAVAWFFERPWSHISPTIKGKLDRPWLLHETAMLLRGVGRLAEALEPMQAGQELLVRRGTSEDAATATSHLSEFELLLGDVAMAIVHAEQAVTYVDRPGYESELIVVRASQADALHQAGRRREAHTRFRESEVMQADIQPDYPLLLGSTGFKYCDLLLAGPERVAWQCILGYAGPQLVVPERSARHSQADIAGKIVSFHENAVSIAVQDAGVVEHDAGESQLQVCRHVSHRAAASLRTAKWGISNTPLAIALDQLTLARAAMCEAIQEGSSLNACHSLLQQAVDGLRRFGGLHNVPLGLLTRAMLRSLTGTCTGPESAQSDLDEAWDIAERGPMPLFLADIHLHRARLFGGLTSEADAAKYPWQSPAADLAAARRLIEKHGYGRRMEELADAEAAASRPPE